MQSCQNLITLKLQIALNRRMYDSGRISRDMYLKANDILLNRLTNCKDHAIIYLNDMLF